MTTAAAVLALIGAACGDDSDDARSGVAPTTPATAVSSSSSAPITPGADHAGRVDIGGGRELYVECRGSGAPTVVFVSGGKDSAEGWSTTTTVEATEPVFDRIARKTRVCAYERPGTTVGDGPGRSDPVPMPITAADAVTDLHALLGAIGETEPVVVVGHSFGGLIARLFAATYPDDVEGLVLVDALSPELQDGMTPAQWEVEKPLLDGDLDAIIAQYPDIEYADNDVSFAQLRAASPLRPMPLVVISADQPYGPLVPQLIDEGVLKPDTPRDFGYVVDAAQAEAQAALAALLPGSVHITETHSGHLVQYEQPELVADAIADVVDRLRDGETTAG